MQSHLQRIFPRLSSDNHQITSDQSASYNCIAWAAGDDSRWWWPDPDSYWPDEADRQETLEAFIAAFATRGYRPCADGLAEDGIEKVVIYVSNETSKPTHAARQLPDGWWTSKCGRLEDLQHSLDALVGQSYGSPMVFLARAIASATDSH